MPFRRPTRTTAAIPSRCSSASADAEQREADLIASYLPEQISDEELRQIAGDAVAESGASSPQEMGKVMSLVMPQVKGRADGKRVSAVVKEMLTP